MLYLLFAAWAVANLHLAPPNFTTVEQEKIVFVDITSAHYEWVFSNSSHKIISTIRFQQKSEGMPVIEFTKALQKVMVNGSPATTKMIAMPPAISALDSNYKVRIIAQNLPVGEHEVVTEHSLTSEGPQWVGGAPTFLMDMWDINTHRGMMERFLPTNLAYDQYKMTMSFDFSAIRQPMELSTNGTLAQTSNNVWTVDYKEHYNSHSIFLHFGPKANYHIQEFEYPSIDGRTLPIKLFMKNSHAHPEFIYEAKEQTLADMKFVEDKLGAFPHDKVVIFIRPGSGGMEYAGATSTGIRSLRHELIHSYYARSVMPANGNANWIDEAVATLIDENVTTSLNTPLGLAANSPYYRDTSIYSYKEGATFLYRLHTKIKTKDPAKSMTDFLKSFMNVAKSSLITTEDFANGLDEYHGETLQPEFTRYMYTPVNLKSLGAPNVNPHHVRTTPDMW